jgi:hypothetical protein
MESALESWWTEMGKKFVAVLLVCGLIISLFEVTLSSDSNKNYQVEVKDFDMTNFCLLLVFLSENYSHQRT